MTYRFPMVAGDRVALAPHLDLFMAGVRYGTVTEVTPEPRLFGARRYLVTSDNGIGHWLGADDLLGAVNPVPGKPVPLSRTERGCYCSDLRGVLCGVCRRKPEGDR